MINGLTCVFQNGHLVNNNSPCSPWGEFYLGNEDCAEYFESCAPEIIELLSDNKFTLPCRQWIDQNVCNTNAFINRPGKVAIGTSKFSSSILTVKNGVLTDKVKVQTCNAGGWCDYVFDEGYPLMPLEEVEAYIEKYRHLPGTPSGSEIEADFAFFIPRGYPATIR